MAGESGDKAARLEAFYTDMALNNVDGVWRLNREESGVDPYLWKWETMRRLVKEAGQLVELDRPGERRAVLLVNPKLRDKAAATPTLYAAIQLVHPGEVAFPHRHTPSAIRFIIEGHGASTTVEGERVPMEEGDLVLTPNWLWHEHRNDGKKDVIWLDGLDAPFVYWLNAAVYEPYPEGQLQEETGPTDYSGRAYGLGTVKPVGSRGGPMGATPLVYRWSAVQEAMARLAEMETVTPYDGVAVEYINSQTGGHVLPTMACWMQLLRPGERTRSHRHTHGSVYHVFRGQGCTIIDGVRFDWDRGDSFVVPSGSWHEHASTSDEPAYLFSMNDQPVLEAFNLHREAPYPERDGHQEVATVFEPGRAAVGAP